MSNFSDSTEYVCLIGDMADGTADYDTSTVAGEVMSVFPNLTYDSIDIIYASHDKNANDDAGVLVNDSTLIYTGYDSGNVAYYIYAISFSDMKSADDSENSAEEFKTWIDGVDEAVPVFVVSHMPLHAQRNDNNGAYIWSLALNYAATGSEDGTEIIRNVVFMHGHNHTTENNQEFYYEPGSTITTENDGTDCDVTIAFTYLTAGYLNANEHAAQITLTDSDISFRRTDSELGTVDRVQGNGYSISLNQSSALLQIRGSFDIQASVSAPEEAEKPAVTWSSSDPAVVSVSPNAGNGATVKGVGLGTATVTATITEGDGITKKSASCVVTVTSTGKVAYQLVSTVEAGKSYLIVSDGYALTNNNGTLDAAAISGKAGDAVITTGGADTLWTFAENSEYSEYGTYTISNDGVYMARSSSKSGSSSALTTISSLSKYGSWNYTSGSLNQKGGSGSSSYYYAYYNSSKSAFYTSSSSASTYLYESQPTVAATGVQISPNELRLQEKQTGKLNAAVVPENATDRNVSWTSADESIATVVDGVVTAVAPGKTTVTVTTEDRGYTAVCEVTVSHGKGTHHEAKAATCGAEGNVEYWDCVGCDAKLNADGEVITDVAVPVLHVHHYEGGSCRDCSSVFDVSGKKTLKLPAALAEIEEEAFAGASSEVIIVPENCRAIAEKAFADCGNLQYIFLPAKLEGHIPENAFDGCRGDLEIIYQ